MDPDDTYTDMVRIARAILREGTANDYSYTAEELAELVVSLDDWIQKGGFLPRKFR